MDAITMSRYVALKETRTMLSMEIEELQKQVDKINEELSEYIHLEKED